MIHGLLVGRDTLCKWKKVNSSLCPLCKRKEDVKHIYFECHRIQEIWNKIGKAIDVKITWKHIVLGFTQDLLVHKCRNLLFKIVLYSIFKTWLHGVENVNNYTTHNTIWHNILRDLRIWNCILYSTNLGKQYFLIRRIWNNCYIKLNSM